MGPCFLVLGDEVEHHGAKLRGQNKTASLIAARKQGNLLYPAVSSDELLYKAHSSGTLFLGSAP